MARHVGGPAGTPQTAHTRIGWSDYDALVNDLRRDLKLRLATDVIGRTRAALNGVGIDSGISGVVFSGGVASSVVTVPHQLGTVPRVVVVSGAAGGQPIYAAAFNPSTLSFDLSAEAPSAITATVPVAWIATV